ncbi:MAG TPA: hypothetical protein VOA80_08370 [Thermoanaerobaculia bacterium]|nr:hypothetical protein [Thermoanaerobaculia bacterium]
MGSETTLSPRARQVERRGWGRDRGRAVVVAVAVALAWLPSPAPLTAIGAIGAIGANAASAANAANASAPAPRAADASSSGGAGGTAAAREATLDAVVQEVLRMLHAKVSEPVILHWLATSGQRPAAVGSREIVELQRAGASDPLMTRLLDLAARQPSPRPAPQPAPEHAAEPSTGTAGAAAGAPAPQAPPSPAAAPVPPGAAAPAAASTPPEHAASMHWRIAYHPNYGADDERWDLYVYLDGRYLAAVKAPTVSFLDPPVELDRSLAPGHHILRLAVERHLRKLGRSGWTHEAKVAPAALTFEIAPDAAGAVELRCETRLRGGPLTLRVTQGDAELAREEPAIAPPDAWPCLCEELTAGQAAGKGARLSSPSSPSSLGGSRSKLSSCLHWADLWPGMEAPPSRDAVRADLERRGFRSDR